MWGLQAHGAMLDFHVYTGHLNLGPTVCVANNLNPSKQAPQTIYVLNWPKYTIDMTFRGDYSACKRKYSFSQDFSFGWMFYLNLICMFFRCLHNSYLIWVNGSLKVFLAMRTIMHIMHHPFCFKIASGYLNCSVYIPSIMSN